MKIRGDLYGAPSVRALNAIITQIVILEAMGGGWSGVPHPAM